jgi:hypothetical protein
VRFLDTLRMFKTTDGVQILRVKFGSKLMVRCKVTEDLWWELDHSCCLRVGSSYEHKPTKSLAGSPVG